MTRTLLVLGVCALLGACEPSKNNSAWSETATDSNPSSATTSAAPPAAPVASSGKGVGPVDHVELSSLDESLEDRGGKLFQEKCSACHKLDERYIGPALVGVTERRQPEWILNMILNPEVMIQQDPTAKGLLAQYIAPMANQHLTREEAECILVYFREHDEEAGEHEGDDDHEASSAVSAAQGH